VPYIRSHLDDHDIDYVEVQDTQEFVVLLTEHTLEGYTFLQPADVTPAQPGFLISHWLLGGVGEFSVYVIDMDSDGVAPPRISCLRARTPLGDHQYPNIDIKLLDAGDNPASDRLRLQEVKTTRADPGLFSSLLNDLRDIYETSRINESVEELKFDCHIAGRHDLIQRINDCVGTNPADSHAIELVPTGVSALLSMRLSALAACVFSFNAVGANVPSV